MNTAFTKAIELAEGTRDPDLIRQLEIEEREVGLILAPADEDDSE